MSTTDGQVCDFLVKFSAQPSTESFHSVYAAVREIRCGRSVPGFLALVEACRSLRPAQSVGTITPHQAQQALNKIRTLLPAGVSFEWGEDREESDGRREEEGLNIEWVVPEVKPVHQPTGSRFQYPAQSVRWFLSALEDRRSALLYVAPLDGGIENFLPHASTSSQGRYCLGGDSDSPLLVLRHDPASLVALTNAALHSYVPAQAYPNGNSNAERYHRVGGPTLPVATTPSPALSVPIDPRVLSSLRAFQTLVDNHLHSQESPT